MTDEVEELLEALPDALSAQAGRLVGLLTQERWAEATFAATLLSQGAASAATIAQAKASDTERRLAYPAELLDKHNSGIAVEAEERGPLGGQYL